MQVNEIMTPRPRTVSTRATVGEAWEALRELHVRHLPVVNEDREIVGILSDRDFGHMPEPPLMNELLGEHMPRLEDRVTTTMTSSPLSVDRDTDVKEVVDLMIDNKIGAVPVVDPEGHVVGIVSYLDVLRALTSELS